MTNTPYNRTKIVATLGPASTNPETLQQMIQAGVDVVRLNMSHGDHQTHQTTINLLRQLNSQLNSHVASLVDLQGPKIRIGEMDEPYPVEAGQLVELCTSIAKRQGNRLPMVLESFARDVKVGDQVLVNDGKVELRVEETNQTDLVKLRVINGSEIGSRKGVNLPDSNLSIASMTDKDRFDLELAILNEVEWVALSFVRRPEDVRNLKMLLQQRDCTARVVAKVEKPEALENIDEIIAESDAIMVARGDLGVEIPIEEVPLWQKQIIRKCRAAAVPVIVATQMLESMIDNPRPTRAEATDVSNAVFDGADAVMLSGETSVGKYPVATVQVMQRILAKAEEDPDLYNHNQPVTRDSPTFLSDATCLTACRFATGVGARAILGMTRSGYTAYQLARHRPNAHIFIFTDNESLLPTLSLVWGVRTFYYDSFVGTNESIFDTINLLKQRELVEPGDIVINTASMPLQARNRTNMMKFTVVH